MNAEEFELKFHRDNYEELEDAFQEARKYLENFRGKISFDEVLEKYPVKMHRNCLSILFPTYIIRLVETYVSEEIVREIEKETDNVVLMVESDVVEYSTMKNIMPYSLYCNERELGSNTALADRIEQRLRQENIKYERCCIIGRHHIYVTVDAKGYITAARK